jgi:nicotinate-nucleotide pyrophosphorylase (carboxylating)
MQSLDAIDPNAVPLPDLAVAIARTGLVRRLLELARDEDLGVPARDPTGELVFGRSDRRRVRLAARSPGFAAGLAFLPEVISVFAAEGEPIGFSASAQDGDAIAPGETLAELEGSARALVRLERTMLNLTARLSGVATRTGAFVRAVEGTGARVCDTRKTTPGMRLLEKYAVRCGGGVCHRMGLHDAVLIKDNHIAGLSDAELTRTLASVATRAKAQGGVLRFVQVEVDTLDQLDHVLGLPAGLIDMVLLDNMGPDTLAEAVRRRDERCPRLITEASGGVTLETVRAVAETGVDRVSVGGLTHQAVSLDLGLDAA